MTYEKIAKHQSFVRSKNTAVASETDIYKANRRNRRLIQLNGLIMEQLIILNNQTMNEVLEDFAEVPESEMENEIKEEIKMGNKKLEDLTHKMDCQMGGIGCSLETLQNIKVTLDNLRVGMDNRKDDEIQARFRDDHRTVQMLQDLMRYTMRELGEFHQKAFEIHHEMFEEIMELDNKKPSSGKTKVA
ncbi:hypothetical protein [Sporosarcina sp. FA9]|uniref:hypothetical protein n=1 Tax=Sporosarcina sp. FA9 TaxID=3413030 RepID=UPI003F65FDBA